MLKNWFFLGFCFWISVINAQESNSLYQSFNAKISKDSIALPHKKLNNSFFEIKSNSGSIIEKSTYVVNFKTGKILFNQFIENDDTIEINYLLFPDFISKTYQIYPNEKVVANEEQLVQIKNSSDTKLKPFDGLNTNGFISRGVTIGNNQNTVLNSNLDLQITGKLSEKVSLKASIKDSNIPLQDGGYSQRLNEFDQIFMELFSNQWNIRAGDVFLENRKATFLNFNKSVQGLSSNFSFGTENNQTDIFAAASIVRGQYAKSSFKGIEGNQGPYKLRGNNGELYVLVISGSERVFVNGIQKKRGENKDYIIDYNAGEIIFTSLFPITSEMRIVVEYQYTDRNYTRFLTYGGVQHQHEKWSIGGYVYSESDVKNQPLQQSLTNEQVEVLKNAGDNINLMNAPSAYLDAFSENKILYKKEVLSGAEIFVFSNNPEDELYNVRFLYVGENLGSYILVNNQAVGKIYEYAPIGTPNRNYEPIVKLISPIKIQAATVVGNFNPNEKTNLDFEVGISQKDQNLYSSINDDDNNGYAIKFNSKQNIFSNKIKVDAFANVQFIQKNFKSIERIFTIEFDRDWNISNTQGNQSLLTSGLNFKNNIGTANYTFEKLQFSDNFSATKHQMNAAIHTKKIAFQSQNSVLESKGIYAKTNFLRSQTHTKYKYKNNWVGAIFNHENNIEKINETNTFSPISQKFSEVGAFIGRGDTTKVFSEIGYLFRTNDSLQNGNIQKVNQSNGVYLNAQLIKSEKSNLSFFVNYRNLKFEDVSKTPIPSLNSRIAYNNRFFDQIIQTSTIYENTAGTIAQQEFTYLEVEPSQGVYTWNDYNNNGIQELQEFEIAPFPDLAKYVRVFLPNQNFLPTHQNKFSQTLQLNFNAWQNKNGFQKIISKFNNQTTYLVEQKTLRNDDSFNLNPFSKASEDILGLQTNFRNSLYFNRGKQNHSVTYNYFLNDSKNLLSVGSVITKNKSHQLLYQHLFRKSWLFDFSSKTMDNLSFSENFPSRNFEISGYQLEPKIAYLFSKNTSLTIFYGFQFKENLIGINEYLNQNKFGTSFNHLSEKGFNINGEFSFLNNSFEGNALSAVGFQLLEGLQAGKNQTWRLLIQKKITQYLDINLNYQGRKSELSKTIHTGNIQLRAFF